MGESVAVIPYDPHWPRLFEAEARIIQAALGDNLITIDRVGSTSVTGLCAKPKIDIIASVQSPEASIAPLGLV